MPLVQSGQSSNLTAEQAHWYGSNLISNFSFSYFEKKKGSNFCLTLGFQFQFMSNDNHVQMLTNWTAMKFYTY